MDLDFVVNRCLINSLGGTGAELSCECLDIRHIVFPYE
jgi:hypothetical protein